MSNMIDVSIGETFHNMPKPAKRNAVLFISIHKWINFNGSLQLYLYSILKTSSSQNFLS